MSSRTQAFALLLFGAALVRLALSDLLLHYVRPVARPWVLLAGVAIVGLAVWSLAARRSSQEVEDGHGHGAVTRVAWLVLAPVIAILVVAPPALGEYSAARQPVTPTVPRDALPALAAGDPVHLTLADFVVRALSTGGSTLTGRQVSLTGFVLCGGAVGRRSGGCQSAAGGQGTFVLSRLVITCCAADARPVEVAVQTSAAIPAQGAWVTVTGAFAGVASQDDSSCSDAVGRRGGGCDSLPVLHSTSVTAVDEPTNPYD